MTDSNIVAILIALGIISREIREWVRLMKKKKEDSDPPSSLLEIRRSHIQTHLYHEAPNY
jgi:hypothetical protein